MFIVCKEFFLFPTSIFLSEFLWDVITGRVRVRINIIYILYQQDNILLGFLLSTMISSHHYIYINIINIGTIINTQHSTTPFQVKATTG